MENPNYRRSPQQMIASIRLCIISMLACLIGFGGFTVYRKLTADASSFDPDMTNLMLGLLGALILMELPVYVIVRKRFTDKLRNKYQACDSRESQEEELVKGFLTLTLIGAAIVEGIGLFGIVITLITGTWLTIVAPAIGLMLLCLLFPSRDRYNQFASNITGQPWN